MNERIRQLRKNLDMTQKQFADSLHVKQNTIATYEMGRITPSDSVIAGICREFQVNEEWLRTGKGEMFLPNQSDELDALAKKYNLSYMDYVFVEKLLKNPELRNAIKDFCIDYANAIIHDTPAGHDTADQIDKEVEAYREELELEARHKEKLSVSDGPEVKEA